MGLGILNLKKKEKKKENPGLLSELYVYIGIYINRRPSLFKWHQAIFLFYSSLQLCRRIRSALLFIWVLVFM